MKRSVFINLLSSMLVTVILIIGVILVLAFTGTLDMQKQKLILSSASHTITYDGKKLTDNKWSLMEGTLKEGHKLAVNVTGSQTNVGMSENYISATITDESGEDVTDEYNIEYRPGALQVKARELIITAESDMKLYDGQPLTCNAYMLQSSVALLDTDRLEVSIEGSVTEVGEADNIITSAKVVSKKTGEDVSRNYHISSKRGKLVIYDESAIVIKSKDAMKQYDPYTALVCYEYEIESGAENLKEGHELRVTFTGAQLLPGWSDNTFEVRVVDKATGADVTHMYDIFKRYGKLVVTNRQISVTGGTTTGIYGTMAFEGSYECEVEGLPEGYTIDASGAFSGEIPAFDYGEVPSKIDTSRIKVLDADGNDVTEYFDISGLDGTIEVLSPDENPVNIFRVRTYDGGELYLKQKSYGDYNISTKKWEEAPEYEKSPEISPYYLTSAGFNAAMSKPDVVEITPLYKIFALPYYAAHKDYSFYAEVDVGENCLQTSDVSMTGEIEKKYTVYQYSGNLSTIMGLETPAALSELEDEYAEFVKENYLSVDEETKSFMLDEYARDEWKQAVERGDVNSAVKNIAEYLRSYWQSGLSYNMEYSRAMDAESNPTIAFLNEYKQGVCRHYAQAATLLYRSLGIPARYTVGFYAYSEDAGMVTVTNKEAHAWVEVYVEDLGWVYVEVTGAPLDDEAVIIQVSPVPNSALYDEYIYNEENKLSAKGVSIKVDGESWKTFEEQGYSVDYVLSGEIFKPGKGKAQIEAFTIYDASFNQVYHYSDGKVQFTDGTFEVMRDINLDGYLDENDVFPSDAERFGTAMLQLYRARIRLASDSFYKTYGDGDEWNNDNGKDIAQCTYSVVEGELADGVGLSFTPKYLSFNEPLKIQANEYTATVVGASADEYLFDTENSSWGTLTVYQRALTVHVGSAKSVVNDDVSAQQYDERADYGEGNKEDTWWENLADGDRVDEGSFIIDTQGTVQYPADRAPTVLREGTLKIYNAAGEDVTSWYIINAIPGTFSIVAG